MTDVALHPSFDLPADASAPRLARQRVAESLAETPRLDELLLCVSEVVTNAVLHGKPPFRITIDRDGQAVRIAVHDAAAAAPVRKSPDADTPTGRGLRLLDRLAIAWGADPTDGGKAVWFTFHLVEAPSAEHRTVRILNLPVDLHRRSEEHNDTLSRELAFVAALDDPTSAPARLRALSEALNGRYTGLGDAQQLQLAEAVRTNLTSVDLDYRLPVELAEVMERVWDLLEEVEDFCRSGDLLTLVTPPDVHAFRKWCRDEIVEQLRGAAPRPWDPALTPAAVAQAAIDPAGTSTQVRIAGELDLERAAELRADLVQRVERGEHRLVIDLTDCTFIDSAGLSLLLTTRARCQASGGSVTLVGVTGSVRRALDVAGVLELLTAPEAGR